MGVSLKGSGEYNLENYVEGFLPANDETTPQVVFITHKVTKIGMHLLRYHLSPPKLDTINLTTQKVDATYFSVPGSFLLVLHQ